MPIYITSGDTKENVMNKDYSKEFISTEIAQLFNSAEKFIVQKDTMIEAIRYMYLHSSCNN